MAFSPDNKWMATPGHDCAVRVWELALDRLMAVACRAAGRNLTAAEWQSYFPGEPYHRSCAQWPVHPTMIAPYFQRARELVASGEIAGAIREYEQALVLHPALGIIPEDEANREAAAYLVKKAMKLGQEGKFAEDGMLAAAPTKDPAVEISASTWNGICWQGGF